jgi:hypothetical protein
MTDKKKEELEKVWNKLSPLQARYLVILARIYILEEKIKKIHPKNLVIPILIIQILVLGFTASTNIENLLTTFAISSFINVAIALIPTLIRKKKFHWI